MGSVDGQAADGRVLVVSGGGRGIGLATLRRWEADGGIGAALDLDPPVTDPPAGGLSLRCDVADEDQVAGAIGTVLERLGRIDAVFHNAGILGPGGHVCDVSLADWDRLLAVHLTGGFLLAKHAVPALRRNPGGSLVFAASMVAGTGSPSHPGYAAAKAALVSLTRSLAPVLGREGIRVNAVSPGSVVGTDFLRAQRGRPLGLTELAVLASRIPLGRAATADDVAAAVCFLASPQARHITGAVLPVDGGEGLRTEDVPTGTGGTRDGTGG